MKHNSDSILKSREKKAQARTWLFLIVAAFFVYIAQDFIKPVLMGAIFAIVLYPLMRKASRIIPSRILSAIVVTAGFALSFILPSGVLLFYGVTKGLQRAQVVQEAFNQADKDLSLNSVLAALELQPIMQQVSDWLPMTDAEFHVWLAKSLKSGGLWVGKVLQDWLKDLPALMLSTLIVLLTTFYLLLDGPNLVLYLRQHSFFTNQQTERLMRSTSALCSSVLMASIVSGIVQSLLMGAACLIVHPSSAVLVTMITFLASFIPVIGTMPVSLFFIATSYINGDVSGLVTYIIFAGLIGVSDNVVRPMILKGGASMHPLIGFMAAFGGLAVIGFYGIFIGPVIAGLFFELLSIVFEKNEQRSTCS